MSGPHGQKAHLHGHSLVHRLPAHAKIVALLIFVLAVVATPRTAYWAFGLHAVLLLGVAALARLTPAFVLKRMLVEIPFVIFALLLPFLAVGERVEVLGLSVSQDGLLAAWNLLAKGTLGVFASIVLAATTGPRDVVLGLQRLRFPDLLVQILAFMIRYLEVVRNELKRMRIARESRCFQARHLGHLGVVARSAGALFVRSYERGERVHLAMLARGYGGRLPVLDTKTTGALAWAQATSLPAMALLIASTAWVLA